MRGRRDRQRRRCAKRAPGGPLRRPIRANEGAGPLPCSARIAGSRCGTNAVSKQVWIPSCMTAADCRSPSAMWERAKPITEARRLLLLVLWGRDGRALAGARSDYESDSGGGLLPVTSHAIRTHLRDRGVCAGVAPQFIAKRSSQLVGIRDGAPTTVASRWRCKFAAG